MKTPLPHFSGDSWQSPDGRAAVYHGDALQLLRDCTPGSCAGVLTDPPYSSGGTFRGDRAGGNTRSKYQTSSTAKVYPEFAGDNRDQRSWILWSTLWLTAARLACQPGAPVCIFSDWRQLPATSDAIQAAGWIWRGIIPWDKTQAARPTPGRPRHQCEYILWGSNGPMATKGPPLPGLVTCSANAEPKTHIAGKPTAMLADVARIFQHAGDGWILDPFAGSAKAGAAVLSQGHRYAACELDPACYQLSIDTLTAATQHPLFEGATP